MTVGGAAGEPGCVTGVEDRLVPREDGGAATYTKVVGEAERLGDV